MQSREENLHDLDELIVYSDFSQATFDGPIPTVFDGMHFESLIDNPRGIDCRGSDAAAVQDDAVVGRGRVYHTQWAEGGRSLKLYVEPDHRSIDASVNF